MSFIRVGFYLLQAPLLVFGMQFIFQRSAWYLTEVLNISASGNTQTEFQTWN
jgi:hypothetical protein